MAQCLKPNPDARLSHSSPILVYIQPRGHKQYTITTDYKCLFPNVEMELIIHRQESPVSHKSLVFHDFFKIFILYKEFLLEGKICHTMTLSSEFGNFRFCKKKKS